jgi:hypothetical protein
MYEMIWPRDAAQRDVQVHHRQANDLSVQERGIDAIAIREVDSILALRAHDATRHHARVLIDHERVNRL